MIYLDYAASTPCDKDVLDVFNKVTLKHYANPNSNHKLGIEAKNLLDNYTSNIANNLGVLPCEIIYTSGASECNNMVIKGICERYKNKGKHMIISSLEHNSVIASATVMQEKGFEIDVLPVLKNGLIDKDALKKLIRDDTILVSVCAVDSELGIRQPVEEIGKMLKEYPNVYFHTDASQIIGKDDIDFTNVDLVTIAPHKFYGLEGIGLLIKKKNVSLRPLIDGGRSFTIYRSGTPCLALVAALDKAIEKILINKDKNTLYVKTLNNIIINKLSTYDKVIINSTNNSVCYIINFSVLGVLSNDFAMMLEKNGIIISTKTSCCPVMTPSKIVFALTKDKKLAASSLRVSLSYLTTKKEVKMFLNVFDKCYKELKESGKI